MYVLMLCHEKPRQEITIVKIKKGITHTDRSHLSQDVLPPVKTNIKVISYLSDRFENNIFL